MAYAALVSLSRAIDQILPQDELYIFLCGKDQIKSLHGKVIALQEFLEFVSGKSRSSELDTLESRITDVAYQLEDIIESIIWRSLSQEIESDVDTQLDSFSSCVEQVDNLLEEAMEMKKISENKDMPPGVFHSRATTSSSPSEVGLGEDLIQILDQIIGKGPKLQIVPITGMGGIGKTTLARAAYEHPRTHHHFDVCLWVTVSQEYNIQDILQGLLPAAERSGPESWLIELVHKRLISRRFLIVLDDMWDEKVWNRVRIALPDDNNGSRVILTTRLLGVAKNVGSSSPVHQMHLLNEEKSWDLLQEMVYCPAEFEKTGRTISRNCKGLPLTIVVISGLLKFNNTQDYWQEVARNTNIHADRNDDDALFGILSLSYTNLPAHLKACFLYMGTYKEDSEISTKELVMLWAAEGFLKPKGSKRMEEVAEECLEELVGRSLVLVTKKRYNGKIRTLSIHDTLRELSLRKAREERFFHHFGEGVDEATFHRMIKEQRRVSFSTPDEFSEFEYDAYDPLVRTFVHNYSIIYSDCFLKFKLLKVLNKVWIRKNSMVSMLSRLTSLRYLHIICERYPPINVPESIAKLRNLETLIVEGGGGNRNNGYELILPVTIWEMPSLKHIITICDSAKVSPVPDKGPVLENLRILSGVTNLILSQSATRIFANLKKLKVGYKVMGYGDQYFCPNNFDDLHQLEELAVLCTRYDDDVPRPPGFTFPHKLKKLTLKRTYISLEDMSLIGSLPNLEVLKLKFDSIIGDTWEPIEGEFAELKYLVMEGLDIKSWRAESIHFPCLGKLFIQNCQYLEEVPAGIGEIESLQQLMVKNCEDAKESVESIREEQKRFGNDLLQVKYFSYSDIAPRPFK